MLGILLRFYLDRELNLIKVNIVIRFKLSPYVASYVANNTAKRQQFKHDDFKKSCYKIMKNALVGKTIENVARRIDLRLINDIEKAQKFALKPHCVSCT